MAGGKQTGRSVSSFSTPRSADLLLQGVMDTFRGSNSKYTIAWRGVKCLVSFYVQIHISGSRNPSAANCWRPGDRYYCRSLAVCLYHTCTAPWPGLGASRSLPYGHSYVTLALDKLSRVSLGRFLPHEQGRWRV